MLKMIDIKPAAWLVAGVAVLALFAGPAQAATTTQTKSCSAVGLLHPPLKAPSCTTAPVVVPVTTSPSPYIASSTARSLLGNAAVSIQGIQDGGTPFAITSCGPTPSTCTASFSGEAAPQPSPIAIQIRCTWNTTMLSLVSITDCRQTLTVETP